MGRIERRRPATAERTGTTERTPLIERPAAGGSTPGLIPPFDEQPTVEIEATPMLERPSAVLAAPDHPVASMPEARVRTPLPPRQPRSAAPAPRIQVPARPERPVAPTPADGEDATVERGATAPQLRRFIKSRAYVPMHELRRRFVINGGDDDVTAVDVDRQRVFVGLPEREGRLLGELLRGGDIGYELSLDPISPIVVGVYPMRPVTRA